jgi:hypothetical protein
MGASWRPAKTMKASTEVWQNSAGRVIEINAGSFQQLSRE